MSKLTSQPRVPWYSGARSLVPMIISSYLELSFTKGLWTEEHGRHVPTSCTSLSDTPSGGSGGRCRTQVHARSWSVYPPMMLMHAWLKQLHLAVVFMCEKEKGYPALFLGRRGSGFWCLVGFGGLNRSWGYQDSDFIGPSGFPNLAGYQP